MGRPGSKGERGVADGDRPPRVPGLAVGAVCAGGGPATGGGPSQVRSAARGARRGNSPVTGGQLVAAKDLGATFGAAVQRGEPRERSRPTSVGKSPTRRAGASPNPSIPAMAAALLNYDAGKPSTPRERPPRAPSAGSVGPRERTANPQERSPSRVQAVMGQHSPSVQRRPPAGDSPKRTSPTVKMGSPRLEVGRQAALHTAPWGQHGKDATVSLVSIAQDANEGFRPYMEDGQHVADPFLTRGGRQGDRWGFFAVFDGHGGRQEVDYCQLKLHDILLSELRSLAPDQDVSVSFQGAFAKIDSQLAMLGAWHSGCTATVALTHRTSSSLTLHVANVGDSRAVLCTSGTAKRLSVDHKASDPSETARIEREGGVVRNGRVGGCLSVSRALGDHNLKSSGVSCVPEVSTSALQENSALVIASDGLWDALQDADAAGVVERCVSQAVAQGADPRAVAGTLKESVAQDLVALAKERGSRDNILVLVIFF